MLDRNQAEQRHGFGIESGPFPGWAPASIRDILFSTSTLHSSHTHENVLYHGIVSGILSGLFGPILLYRQGDILDQVRFSPILWEKAQEQVMNRPYGRKHG